MNKKYKKAQASLEIICTIGLLLFVTYIANKDNPKQNISITKETKNSIKTFQEKTIYRLENTPQEYSAYTEDKKIFDDKNGEIGFFVYKFEKIKEFVDETNNLETIEKIRSKKIKKYYQIYTKSSTGEDCLINIPEKENINLYYTLENYREKEKLELEEKRKQEEIEKEEEKKQKEEMEKEENERIKEEEKRLNQPIKKIFSMNNFLIEYHKNRFDFGDNYGDKKIKITEAVITNIKKTNQGFGDAFNLEVSSNGNITEATFVGREGTSVKGLQVGQKINVIGFYFYNISDNDGLYCPMLIDCIIVK